MSARRGREPSESERRSLRVVFLGNDRWSVPPLAALAASRHDLVLVVTSVPKPAGRRSELTPTPVAEAAGRLGLPLVEVESVKEGLGFERLAAAVPDVLAVVAYGELLPLAVLRLPAVAPVNLHFSLLPLLRGASPVRMALALGATTTGVTTIVMDEGLDTGPVLLQREEPIRPDDDAGSLGARLAEIGGALLVESIDRLASGTVSPRPQEGSIATFAPKLGPQDRVIDWSKAARVLVNEVRALSPDPAATTMFRGKGLKIFRADAVDGTGRPGTVKQVSKDGFVIATADGGLRPLELGPAGRRRMTAAEFVNGYRPEVGERLG